MYKIYLVCQEKICFQFTFCPKLLKIFRHKIFVWRERERESEREQRGRERENREREREREKEREMFGVPE